MHSEIIKKKILKTQQAPTLLEKWYIFHIYKDVLQRSSSFCLLKILFLSSEWIKIYKDKQEDMQITWHSVSVTSWSHLRK